MYICKDCGAVFEYPRIDEYFDSHGDCVVERFKQTNCPDCGSSSIDEADECPVCGECKAVGKPICDRCKSDLMYKFATFMDDCSVAQLEYLDNVLDGNSLFDVRRAM